jgi:hypothetical protein
MAQNSRKIKFITLFLFLFIYFLSAARPIPLETVLAVKWISSLETDEHIVFDNSAQYEDRLLSFTLGNHFGYVDPFGDFSVNKVRSGNIYLSKTQWTEYEAEPDKIEIQNTEDDTVVTILNPAGYPVLLDNRIFILGSDQYSLTEIDNDGNALWTYDFGAPLTCIDAAAGLVLTGSIDGIVEILDANGKRIFYFEPGGSRYAVITGCAISRNGMRVGIISGIEAQRFLLLEKYGNSAGEYKVIYHDSLDAGFRRPVYIAFIDQDKCIIYERPDGLGCFDIKSRKEMRIPVQGGIIALEDSGEQGFFFLISSNGGEEKELLGVRFNNKNFVSIRDKIFIRAPFKSNNVFLGRIDRSITVGGGSTLISYNMEKK